MFKYKPPGDLDDLHQRPSREAFLELLQAKAGAR